LALPSRLWQSPSQTGALAIRACVQLCFAFEDDPPCNLLNCILQSHLQGFSKLLKSCATRYTSRCASALPYLVKGAQAPVREIVFVCVKEREKAERLLP